MRKITKAVALILILATLASLSSVICYANVGESAGAESFLLVVERLNSCSGILEREEVYLEATAEGVFFDDVSYPGVADALAALAEVKRQIDLSQEFVLTVDGLTAAAEESYVSLRALLNRAAECYAAITDRGYTGVIGAYNKYSSVLSVWVAKERFTAEIISSSDNLALAQTYRDKDYIIESIEMAMENEDFIPDHPDVPELLRKIALAKDYMREATIRANQFIGEVESIRIGAGYAEALLEAYISLSEIDTTTRGAGAARNDLLDKIDSYNRDVAEINSVFG